MYQQPADRTFWPHVESERAAPLAQVRRPDLEREVRQQASTALAGQHAAGRHRSNGTRGVTKRDLDAGNLRLIRLLNQTSSSRNRRGTSMRALAHINGRRFARARRTAAHRHGLLPSTARSSTPASAHAPLWLCTWPSWTRPCRHLPLRSRHVAFEASAAACSRFDSCAS